MILNTAPQNEAVLSNVDRIGEFRIRNSAKAFNILSSGLYANKIRAIIRELSCNAVDSHVAAGKEDVPFEVHLPTALEPHFSIRDFGTGLSHEQVTNIYTTYFESTKTDSNSFIGALGLGSKSPFSYTDNFSVIAYKDGKFGIYSAFINENGVPSIALMTSGETDEPNGIEVKFSVNDRTDCIKFVTEAQIVYRYFALIPIVKGAPNFKLDLDALPYETKDIIPGVHSLSNTFNASTRSFAVMGNIAYPIQVPNASENLGTLTKLLDHGFEMHFGIGELDFQASREGLSYVPMTIQSIKKKLTELKNQLDVVIKRDADAIPNMWQRIQFLQNKNSFPHWQSSVDKYLGEIGLKTSGPYSRAFPVTFKVKEKDLEEKYNIRLRGTERIRGISGMRNVKSYNEYFLDPVTKQSYYASSFTFNIIVDVNTQFIINDTAKGGFDRVRYHYRQTQIPGHHQIIYLIEAIDKTKPVLVNEFFNEIMNPPAENIKKLSELGQKPRKSSHSKDVSILRLDTYTKRHRTETVWVSDKNLASFNDTDKFYYLPISGFKVVSEHVGDVKLLSTYLKTSDIDDLKNITIYGVRKADLENVKQKSNWINLETHIISTLSSIDKTVFKRKVVSEVPSFVLALYGNNTIKNMDSLAKKIAHEFHFTNSTRYRYSGLMSLYNVYNKSVNIDPNVEIGKYREMIQSFFDRYPLIQYLIGAPSEEVISYINLIDDQKGIK
jgi:hypothetical protein